MICLAFDTAGKTCSACLYDSETGTILASVSEEIGKGHAERLMDIIGDVMATANVTYQNLDKIITTVGPGSFTGIRVGVATARGFGVGLEIPVIGVSNLEAILFEYSQKMNLAPSQKMGAAITAGRGQVYCQFNFASPFAKADEPFVADLEEVQRELSKLSNIVLCGSAAATILPDQENPEFDKSQAEISFVAKLGAERAENNQKPEPLYLRKPDAVPQKGFAVERVS